MKADVRPEQRRDERRARPHRRLFRKYLLSLVGLVCVLLIANGVIDSVFSYRDVRENAVRLQSEKAQAAAQRIEQFVAEIERQIGWTTTAQWAFGSVEQQRFDFVRLLRQVPAITELLYLDSNGKEMLKVSRLGMDVAAAGTDYSSDDLFRQAIARGIWFSDVYFRYESEPYMTMALVHGGNRPGVTVAIVNLKLIWDVISAIKVGERGLALVVDRHGRLIAHPDISLVLRNSDLSHLPQVVAAREDDATDQPGRTVTFATDQNGERVLSAFAPIPRLGWFVFVELPFTEALSTLFAPLLRTFVLLAGGIGIAAFAALALARRMTAPIRQLEAGAARIGAGDLSHRLSIRTGDELELLAESFNQMAGQLQESYAGLEDRVEQRTRELAEALEDLKRLNAASQAVNTTLDVEALLAAIVAKAVQLADADSAAIYLFNAEHKSFQLRASHGLCLQGAMKTQSVERINTVVCQAASQRRTIHVTSSGDEADSDLQALIVDGDCRAIIATPLLSGGSTIGALVVRRRAARSFAPRTIGLIETFAAQLVLAIRNAQLFAEIDAKSRELEIVSRHKSQFLANMSHELRTPMNAVLGFSEMLTDGLYGPLPEAALKALGRVHANGQHLLSLINDVLDLSKIEAGQLSLTTTSYSLPYIVRTVLATVEALAMERGLSLSCEIEPGLPPGFGDERRLTQVLLNLVGNAIKFTDQGSITVTAGRRDDNFEIAVRDTGPGIPPDDQERIFEEFRQLDSSSTRAKGGSGLGLAISRRLIGMHGGTLQVESALGSGSTFRIILPMGTPPAGELE